MSNVVKVRRSYVASAVPTIAQLEEGQLAVNIADRLLYIRDNADNIISLGGAGENINVTGDVTGSGPASDIVTTLAASGVTAGTYNSVTVDAKGRVTVGANPTTLAGYGITDALPLSGGTVTGNIIMSGATVQVPTPILGTDAANKNYVDNSIAGIDWKQEVFAASTGNLTLSGEQTVDGVALVVGNRVLVKDQTDATTNGIYLVAVGAWSRAPDSDTGAKISGEACVSIEGTLNAASQWVNTNRPFTIGVISITYVRLNVGTAYTAGTGLTLTGNAFSITNSGVTAGTYTKVTVNAQGQVTVGAALSSSDVTTALTYTPYNGATNPNGYISGNQNITVSGDATGSGSTAITLTLANSGVTAGTYNSVTVDAKGRVTAATNTGAASTTLTGDVTGTGTGTVATTLANSGVTAGTYTKVTVDAKGRVTVGAALSSSDVTAALAYTPLQHNENITVSGDATGSGTTAIALTLANSGVTAGTYNWGTVNAKGLVTAANDVSAGTITLNGDVTGTGTGTVATTLANSGVTAGTYTKVTVNAKGLVTVGTALNAGDITTALTYTPVNNAGDSVSGNLTMTGGATVTGLPTPVGASDAVPKSYLDSLIQGMAWKTEAAVATTANITLSGTQTIDGYSAVAGDRVLVKNQTTQTENGIYVVASGAWSRAADADLGTEIKGSALLVLNGAQQYTQWLNNNTGAITIGTTNITFVQLFGGSGYTASTGLTLTGNAFSITNTGVTAGTYTKVTVNAQGQVTVGAALSSSDVTTALTYTPLQHNESITLSGDATGSGTTAIAVTLSNSGVTAGTYNSVTVNAKGLVTAASNTGAASTTLTGDVTGTGTGTVATTLANSGATAGTYTKVTVNAKGLVTVGAALNASDVTTALTYTPVNKAGDTITGALNEAANANVASAATTNIGAAASNNVNVTGAVTITAFDSIAAGAKRVLTFASTPILTYNAVSLILPTAANITAAAGDTAEFESLGSGNWKCLWYQRASGLSLVGSPDATKLPLAGGTLSGALNLAPQVSLAAAATTNIGAAAANSISITGSTAITAFDTIAAGAIRELTFTGTPVLTYNATSLILPTAASITAAAGDVAVFESLGAGNWKCVDFMRASGQALAGTPDATKLPLAGGTLTGPLTALAISMGSSVLTAPQNLAESYKFTDKGTVNNGTATFTRSTDGSWGRVAPTGTSFTLAVTGWPASGQLGEMGIELINGGAAGLVITWPTINWVKSDGSFTTTFSANGVTLQASGTDFIILWTRDGGTTVYGKVIR